MKPVSEWDKWDFFEMWAKTCLRIPRVREKFVKLYPEQRGDELMKTIRDLLVFRKLILIMDEKKQEFRIEVRE